MAHSFGAGIGMFGFVEREILFAGGAIGSASLLLNTIEGLL